jgi:hypothetical protein
MTGEKSLVNGGIRNGEQWSMMVNERMRIGGDLGARRVGTDTTAPTAPRRLGSRPTRCEGGVKATVGSEIGHLKLYHV